MTNYTNKEKLYRNKDWLEEQYITNKLSMNRIATITNVSANTVCLWLKKFDIPMRNILERMNTPDVGKQISDKLKGRSNTWAIGDKNPMKDPEIAARNTAARINKPRPSMCGENNPAKRPEVRAKISVNNPMRRSEEREKLRGIKPAINSSSKKFNGNWYTKLDGSKIWLRSSYEIRTATILDKLCVSWIYEPTAFELTELETTYRPDFYLPELDVWWEVKGWMRPEAKSKIIAFYNTYKNEFLYIIEKNDIEYLENLPINCSLYDVINVGKQISENC